MMDLKKAAADILAKRGGGGDGESSDSDGSSGPGALSAMFAALKAGKDAEAYDAFRAAVQSCGYSDEEE
jgi:hypothetical protein